MTKNTSQHVLSTSASLLGFCLVVITSLHIANRIEKHLLDEFTLAMAVVLAISCLFSFISIRTTREPRERIFENIAFYLFIFGLLGILLIIFLISLQVLE
jgi:drug/metabolite transporter (DMT)-like permease